MPLLGVTLSNFGMNLIFTKSRVFMLSDSEEIVMIQYQSVTDRQADRQT